MNKAIKSLLQLAALTAALAPNYDTYACIPTEKTKERTIRKCADPKKKAKRKAKETSKRKNRR